MYIHCESKTRHHSLVRNFAKCLPIFKILSLLDSALNLQQLSCLEIPPHLDRVATLPCEISQGAGAVKFPVRLSHSKTVSKHSSGEISSL